MKYILAVLFSFSLSQIAFSQTDAKTQESNRHHDFLLNEVKILNMNVTGYSYDVLGAMKDEFLKWDGKVTSVTFDEVNMTMEIKHNGLFIKSETMGILEKFGIASAAIISYE